MPETFIAFIPKLTLKIGAKFNTKVDNKTSSKSKTVFNKSISQIYSM